MTAGLLGASCFLTIHFRTDCLCGTSRSRLRSGAFPTGMNGPKPNQRLCSLLFVFRTLRNITTTSSHKVESSHCDPDRHCEACPITLASILGWSAKRHFRRQWHKAYHHNLYKDFCRPTARLAGTGLRSRIPPILILSRGNLCKRPNLLEWGMIYHALRPPKLSGLDRYDVSNPTLNITLRNASSDGVAGCQLCQWWGRSAR